jgi:tetratricopeptide (TPR) repeat protein
MRRWTLFLLIVLILSACTPKAYTESLDAGKAALEKGNYTEAANKFENALEAKETDEAKDYLQAAESMQESLALYHKGDFDAAVNTLNKLLHQKSTKEKISQQATALLKEIQEAKSLANSLNERMIKGKTLLEQNQFDQAIEVFKEVSQTLGYPENASIEKLTNEASQLVIDSTNKKKAADQAKKKHDEAKKQENAKEKKKDANETLSHSQAEDLVRKHLGLQADQNVKVVYDHDADNGDYIIHVYEFVVDNSSTGEGHTTTRGWYGVNKNTKAIYDAME